MDKTSLVNSYNADSHRRANVAPEEWKVKERGAFLGKLQSLHKSRLLEIGAGAGGDSLFFQENGLEVTSIDMSPEMIAYCREKGLDAHIMDFYNLDFADETFDAVYALNCLLHVPKDEIAGVLREIKRVMKPGALFYMGLYGGKDSEGVWEDDWCEPKRFFAFYSDESLRALAGTCFREVGFRTIPLEEGKPYFQSLILQK